MKVRIMGPLALINEHPHHVFAHLREAYNTTAVALALDWYRDVEAAGAVCVVLEEDTGDHAGDLVGYVSMYPTVLPHEHGASAFMVEAVYLVPWWRNSIAGGRLVKLAERVAKERGGRRIQWDVPPECPLGDAFAKRSEYRRISVIYEKEL